MSLKSIQAALCILAVIMTGPISAAALEPGAAPFSATIAGSSESVTLPTPRPATTLVPRFSGKSPTNLGVFKSVAISAARLPAAAKWQAARAHDHTALFKAQCDGLTVRGCNTSFASKMQAVAGRAAGLSDRALLDLVNRTVNGAMRYREDRAIWDVGDYWASPGEMAIKGAGDCEDFAIAKYWLLRSLGVADDKLQLVVLQDTRRRLFHAVLVVHTASGAYVLDNVSNRLRPDTAYAQYHPIMSFAGNKNFIHGFAAGTRSTTAMPSDLSAVAPGSGM